MSYPRRERTDLVKDCSHAYSMTYLEDRCWCEACGQTWKWLGAPKGWYAISVYEAKNGERIR